MEVRNSIHPEHARHFTTAELRKEFLVNGLLIEDRVKLVYSHIDRLILGGALPLSPLTLEVGKEIIGCDYLLERRELGIINIGGPGLLTIDGAQYSLNREDGIYIGKGSRQIRLESSQNSEPAKYYLISAPAHKEYPVKLIPKGETEKEDLGSAPQCNIRTIYKYIHPNQVPSCQLVMGLTKLAQGNVWNTMPCHTHVRRMEVYFHYNMDQEAIVFHLMGEPQETRHIVVRNEEAVLGPSWSIHSGVGTKNYSFIWAMLGENQTFTDMDGVALDKLM